MAREPAWSPSTPLATWAGPGTIGGIVSVAAGGTLAPGAVPGLLTITNDLSLNNGSVLQFAWAPSATRWT